MSGDMPPLNMTTQEDQIIGLDADLAALIADAMGVKLNLQKMAFASLLPAMEAGSIDMIISNMTMTPDRNTKVAFVGPYFTSGKGLLTKRSALGDAMKMEDLDNINYTFVALKGSTSEAVARKGAPLAKLATVSTENEVRADGDRRQGRRHAGRLSDLHGSGLPPPRGRPGAREGSHHL
jgi:polar amino acid transport system substrate-binding protein